MEVILARSAGFCYGVRRAVEMAEAEAMKGPVYLLGHITHNDHVIRHLEKLGAVTVTASAADSARGFVIKKLLSETSVSILLLTLLESRFLFFFSGNTIS